MIDAKRWAKNAIRLSVAAILLATTPIADAQTRSKACGDRSKVIERLADKYGETLQSLGLHHNNGVLEVYASEDTGSWTILITRPDGVACLVASGQMWEAQTVPLRPHGKDA